MKISVIVTVYNLESLIGRCLDSLINQTFADYEIITVNDESKDNSLSILKEYATKYSFIKIVDNAVNVGSGVSRQNGLKEAIGDYITFVDGDDYVEKDYLETLYNAAIENDADLVGSGLYRVKDTTIVEYNNKKSGVYYGIDKLNLELSQIHIHLLTKLIRRTLFEKVDYSPRRYIEDTPVLLELLYYANKLVVIDYYGYYYYIYEKSLTQTVTGEKDFIYQSLFSKDMTEFFKDKDEEWKKKLRMLQYSPQILKKLIWLNQFDVNKLREQFPSEWAELEKDIFG